jgi:hypothetical protein
MQCKQYIGYLHQQLVQYHNNVLCNGLRDVKPSVHTVVQVPVDDSAATAAPASSAGTPG